MRTVPEYMEKGSKGPAVNVLLVFLMAWSHGLASHELKCDDELGDTGMKWLGFFQDQHGLERKGGCGPDTRAKILEKYGIDFDDLVRRTARSTSFVQPDGEVISWHPA